MRRPTRARTSLLLGTVVLTVALPASAGIDRRLAAARATLSLPRTSEGMQARYDAGRAVEDAVYGSSVPGCLAYAAASLGRGLVRQAEGYDRARGSLEGAGRAQAAAAVRRADACPRRSRGVRLHRGLPRLPALPRLVRAAPERSRDAALASRLAALGRSFPGWAGLWVHDLVSGRTAGWNADAQFPAASTVKLGVLLATLARLRHPAWSPLDYDMRAIAGWSSNPAANRLFERLGGHGAVEAALRHVGAYRSTFPQGYRVGTSRLLDVQNPPPLVSGRITTAHDLGRILYAFHAGALGNLRAFRLSGLDRDRSRYALALLLSAEPAGNNAGLLRPWLSPHTRIAQKNGWIEDARHTAAIVYGRSGPRIVVVLTYARGMQLTTAQRLGREVLALLR